MQNDLISRSALIDDILAAAENGGMGALVAGTLRRYVLRQPAVDAVEVDKAMAWLEGYTMTDTKQIYSNGIVYVPMFRVEQAFVDKAYNGSQEG